MPAGEYRGWADRLAELLAHSSGAPFRYANLAVRSRRVRHLTREQLPRALELQPDLVSVFIGANDRSEEHTSELQSLMRISYAVFCLKKKTNNNINPRDPETKQKQIIH